jgi:phytoene/squalene synthetase
MEPAPGIALAHHLGRALQLTNILRDIDEDAAIGRLYLPREALAAAGITTTDPIEAAASRALDRACLVVAERARLHFGEAETVMRGCPRATVRTPRVMAEAYRSMLDTMVARGWSPPRHRVRINKLRLAWILLRHAIF